MSSFFCPFDLCLHIWMFACFAMGVSIKFCWRRFSSCYLHQGTNKLTISDQPDQDKVDQSDQPGKDKVYQ